MLGCRNKGFILLVVLVVMQILAVLGMFSYVQISHALKMEYHHGLSGSSSLAEASILKQIYMSNPDGLDACQIKTTSPAFLRGRPASWWVTQACTGIFDKNRYYYVVETLGRDVCGLIGESSTAGANLAAYYRVTVYSRSGYLWQGTYVKPFYVEMSACVGKTHQVKAGVQMIRELN